MESPQRPRKKFRTTQDWHNWLIEMQQNGHRPTGEALFALRKAVYGEIEALRGWPVLVYATKFLEGVPNGAPNFINISDVDGFTDLVNSVEKGGAVDVLLHSPGGHPDATERLVGLLRGRFDTVNFLIPHSAYSAATMLALSGDCIILHPSATLGPIDPQVNGRPTRSIKRGFENAKERIAKEGPETLPAYLPLIEQYSLDLLEICDDSEKLAKKLVSSWLKRYMFKGEKNVNETIRKAVDYLSNYDRHLLHSRPLPLDKLSKFKLKIELANDGLQDLLWEAHILLNGFFNHTLFVKLYESARGVSWGKQFQPALVSPHRQVQQVAPQP